MHLRTRFGNSRHVFCHGWPKLDDFWAVLLFRRVTVAPLLFRRRLECFCGDFAPSAQRH